MAGNRNDQAHRVQVVAGMFGWGQRQVRAYVISWASR